MTDSSPSHTGTHGFQNRAQCNMSDYQQGPDFQFILRVLNTNVDGRESEFEALLRPPTARGDATGRAGRWIKGRGADDGGITGDPASGVASGP